jgi:uncharacterized protein with von Willebrand factor type A (vWA) domain
MKTDELPLLELFTRLRQAGLPLGVNEYQLILRALQCGFGIPNREDLARLCCTLWVKSAEDKLLFNYHFEEVMVEDVKEVMAEDKAAILPAELLLVSPEPELPKNPIIILWRKISLPALLALSGMLVLVTGISLWSVRPICPYFTSKPEEFVEEGKVYSYEITACKATPTDKVEIKPLQKHPLLQFKDRQNGTAILRGLTNTTYYIVNLWDLQGNLSETNVLGYFETNDISFSPDGQYFVTLSDNKAHLWNLQGKPITNFGNLKINNISFSPDGQYLVTKLTGGKARLWNLQGKLITNFGNLKTNDIRFSPDGQYFVTLTDDTARLWNLQGKPITNFGNQINNISFSPDGQHFVTLTDYTDYTARLWNLQGKLITNFGDQINYISFSPDGQYFVTKLTDGKDRLWNLQGKPITNFDKLKIVDISFSPDKQHLLTVSISSEVKLQVTDKATGKSDTQTFSLKSSRDFSAFSEQFFKLLIGLGLIIGFLVALVLPGGYITARLITQRNAKPPDFPPVPEPDEETLTPISALNQELKDEVQVAQAIHQGTRSNSDTPLSSFTESSEYFPVTSRQMKQSWRYLRRFIRQGPPIELDVEATVQQMSRQGMLLHPVLKPRRVNRNELLLLVDQDGSMAPFHSLSERLAETAIQGGRLGKASIFYFHNCPIQHLYQDPYHQIAEPIGEILAKLHPEYAGILIFSDAGAARGAFSRERLDLTAEFLDQLRQKFRHIAWLNPLPRDHWTGTAEEISKIVPMFELSRQGLNQAIDVLRGKPTAQMGGKL